MTTSNMPVSASSKSALMTTTAIPGQHKSSRPHRLSAKIAHRRTLPKSPRSISFEALAEDPIYRRIANELCPEDLATQIMQYGFESAAAIAACKSVPVMKTRMARAGTRVQAEDVDILRLHCRSRREALRSYRLMRHELAVNDPVNQALRHTPSGSLDRDASPSAQVQAYAKPASLQSNQSPAAYLRYLYRIATGQASGPGIFSDADNPFALVDRRPDLAKLVLNQANLKREVPTIQMVNEVLRAGISDFDKSRHEQTVALPYDHTVTTARTALAALGGTRINDIALRTAQVEMGAFTGHRWAQDTAGLIGVLGAEDKTAAEGNTLLLVSEDTDEASATPMTVGGLYKATSTEDACLIGPLMSTLGLDADGLAQLFGLYSVAQENGAPVAQGAFATAFLANDAPITLRATPLGKAIAKDNAPLSAPELRAFNYLARLHHSTGLEFHDLNTILALPGAATAPNEDPNSNHRPSRRVTAAGMRLLASYPLYGQAFGLTPAGFAAFFGEISPFRRADQTIAGDTSVPGLEQTEQSFMASLFQDDAPQVHRLIVEGRTPIQDEAFSTLTARGFGLSTLELETIVEALDDSFALSEGVDARGLAALYRMVTLCRMLGWPVLAGLTLMQQISGGLGDASSLWATLTHRNETEAETDALCSAIEWLADLARWMVEAEVTPEALLALIVSPPVGGAPATDADIAWFDAVARAYAPVAMQADTFAEFETWSGGVVSAEVWLVHMTGDGAICDSTGVFLENVGRDEIDAACRACLTREEIDPEEAANAALVRTLVDRLEALQDGQINVIEAQVVSLDAQISAASAAAVLNWAQTGALDLLGTVLQGADNSAALFLLAEMRRHIAVVTRFDLGDIELEMLGHTPHWIAPELADADAAPRPLSLSQLIWVQRFADLQVAPATDAALRGYLVLTNAENAAAEMPDEMQAHWVAGSRETLALLLNCPSEDMGVYADALIGAGEVARDIAQIDLIARHVRLAAELNLSAKDLLALKRVSTSQQSGDWSAAAAAAQAGLARFDDGNQMPGFRQSLAEHERDALVPAFMQTRIAGHEELESRISNSEQLYSYLLLDVNVTSAVPTSRMVEAISSLQLFISRALDGLEPGVNFMGADGVDHRETLAAQWELDKEYRQWEANQKLMLHPQNYIEPELRQITSPEFNTLEQAVSGGEVTPDSVEAAVNTYMKDLAGLCDLSLCSLYVERRPGDNEIGNTDYHLLAKAKWEPGRFFYRKLEADFQTIAELQDQTQYLKAMDWTYWQEVSIPKTFELFSDVTVCVFDNRYYFFWLELEERRVPVEGGDSAGQQKSLWRLHPRYMRCDQNALAGPMLTPGLFVDGALTGEKGTLTIDGAFEWTGAKPSLYTTFHPTLAPAGVAGKLGTSRDHDSSAMDTLTVTFAIGLPTAAKEPKITKTALHIRLSEEWSDAILNLNQDPVTIFADNAPNGYASIHPRPVAETNAVADQYKIDREHEMPSELNGVYTYDKAKAINGYEPGTTRSSITFTPDERTNGSLGSVELTFDLGKRRYSITAYNGRKLELTEEKQATKLTMRFLLTFETQSGERKHYQTNWKSRTTKRLPETRITTDLVSHHGLSSGTVYHNTNERFSVNEKLPEDWIFETSEPVTLKVRAEVKREFGNLRVKTNKGAGTKGADADSAKHTIHMAAMKLYPPKGKNNSGWAQTGEHGSRNFLHLTDKESRTNAETFVLSNSSTVLSGLAKTMPRPGGCETLFALNNQSGQEDFGTFFDDFATTLGAIYKGDETVLSVARMPGEDFDFDSAYGAYGWEVFYHIPAAIAAGYAGSGQFDLAMQWLRRIFDPQLQIPWRVQPLLDATEPTDGLAFDTGDVIVDPDRIARDYPFYYQQATIRNMLEVLLDAGDAQFEQQTQESLQRAKALYVSAKQLFSDTLSETLESLTSTPWTDPTLGDAVQDGYDGFLPPYNEELSGLYETLEERLFNLRRWLDLNGQPLNVPLLAQPIDPQALQRTAKSRLHLRDGRDDEEAAFDSPLDFPYVIRSVKGYLNNLKLTSHRLQDSNEKLGDSEMEEFRMDAAVTRSDRTIGLQDLAIEVADMDVTIKRTKVAMSTMELGNHVTNNLTQVQAVFKQSQRAAIATLKNQKTLYTNTAKSISAVLKSTIPNTFGFSNGGQNLEQADLALMTSNIVLFLHQWGMRSEIKDLQKQIDETGSFVRKTQELAAKVTLDGEDLAKAKKAASKEQAARDELKLQHQGAKRVRDKWDDVFGGSSFYGPFSKDLEALYAEEWATTQAFCKLLVNLYEDETDLTNGATFLRTISLGDDIDKFNAPHRLALDVERLEMAYIQAVLDNASQTTALTFALSELPALGSDHSALEELTTQGEVYFHLTDEMFDVFYPGQYDRRIQSLNIRFPGLAEAGLSPHARLTQVSNTRFMAPDRDPKRGSKIRKDRHGLQTLVLGACEVDTRQIEAPDGLLKRFQNTGVESCWHVDMPAVRELQSGKTARNRGRDWRAKAEQNHEKLQSHMTEVDFTIRFSGRWTGPADLRR